MFQEIDQYVDKCIVLSKEEREYFHSLFEYRKVKKKTFLLQAGEICDFEAYIIKGCIRTYYIDANGFDVILGFSIEDWWVSDVASFSQQKKSSLFIETLEDTELMVINYKNKEQLFKNVPQFEHLFRLMIQRTHETIMNRLIATMSKPAEERYLDFIAKYPGIPQRVPQRLIASFLGISPEFLSKIRHKLAKK